MLKKSKCNMVCCSPTPIKSGYPEPDLEYIPLSGYIAGAIDVTGKALEDAVRKAMFDDYGITSSPESDSSNVDPFCDPRLDIFDHVERANDPEVVADIQAAISANQSTAKEPTENQPTE